MRAQFVYENVRFERGIGPKGSLGLGDPIKLEDVYREISNQANDEYENFIKKTFLGKRVWGTMDSWRGSRGDWKEWVIIPTDIDHRFHGDEFSFIDEDGEYYTVLTSKPLRILDYANEGVNFTKTGNPKAGLDIGGFKLSHIRKEIIDQAKDDWIQWVYDYIIGKTVSGKFNRIAKITDDGYEYLGDSWDSYNVKVEGLVSPETIEMDHPALFVIGEDKYQYVVPIGDEKIWIKP